MSSESFKSRLSLCKDEIHYVNNLYAGLGRKILDLGCGTGVVSSSFNSNYTKYGLEVSEVAAKYAAKYLDHLHVGELTSELYEDEFFDIVFCYHVIEHVADPVSFVKNICRILKTGGSLIIGAPNFDSAMARRFGTKYRMLHDKTHVSLFSDFSLRDMLDDYGFHVFRIEYPYFETEYFNKDSLLRVFDTNEVSPPFYGNFMTLYALKK